MGGQFTTDQPRRPSLRGVALFLPESSKPKVRELQPVPGPAKFGPRFPDNGRGRLRKHLFVDPGAGCTLRDKGSAVLQSRPVCSLRPSPPGPEGGLAQPAAAGASFAKEDLRGPGGPESDFRWPGRGC